MNNVTFVVQIEAKDTFIGQADLFCYSLNKIYPDFKVVILSEKYVNINRNNTEVKVIPNTIYPKLADKLKDKAILAIRRFTYMSEFFNTDTSLNNENLVIATDPDTAFINSSKFLDTFKGITKNIMGVGPMYTVPTTTIKYFKLKSGGVDFKLYSAPIGSHGSNWKVICDEWLKVWSYYINDPELFTKTETFDHGNGYLLEMMPISIVAKNLNLNIIQMFDSYYSELFHYFHPLQLHLKTEWSKRKINWAKGSIQKIQYEETPFNKNLHEIKFYKLFNEWVDNS